MLSLASLLHEKRKHPPKLFTAIIKNRITLDSNEEVASAGENIAEEDTPVAPSDKAGVKRKQSLGRKNKDPNKNTTLDNKDTAIPKLHAAIAKTNKERLALETAPRDNLKDAENVITNKVDTMDKNENNLRSITRRWKQLFRPSTWDNKVWIPTSKC